MQFMRFLLFFVLASLLITGAIFSATVYVNATRASSCDPGANFRVAAVQDAVNGEN